MTPLVTKDELHTVWLEPLRAFKTMRLIANEWSGLNTGNAMQDGFRDVLMELWSAERRLISYPKIAVLYNDSTPIGVLSGVDWPSRKRFYIESLIVHPVLSDPGMVHHVYHLLIEAAMDRSHKQGWHGWIETTAPDEQRRLWTDLRFPNCAHVTYCRMGYFE